jgi:hypothetical protein
MGARAGGSRVNGVELDLKEFRMAVFGTQQPNYVQKTGAYSSSSLDPSSPICCVK